MGRDLRFALRALWRQPGFSALTILILALGLGAATAMFSIVNALILRPLSFPDGDRLVRMYGTVGARLNDPVPGPALRHYRDNNTVFDGLASFWWTTSALDLGAGSPEPVWLLKGTTDFFSVLGTPPLLGRVFLPEEATPGRTAVVVLSHRLWQSRFAGDRAVLGRTLRLDGETVTIVGVMPPQFNDPTMWWARVDLWRPMALEPGPGADRLWGGPGLARLKPGVSLAVAQAQLSALAAHVPDTGATRGVRIEPLQQTRGIQGAEASVAWLTMGLAVFVLLIACINLAAVQLSRLAGRGHEQAIRVALGASRRHLIRQTLAESLLLSATGGLLGVLLAQWLTGVLGPRMTFGVAQITVGVPADVDGRVLIFALGLMLLTALVVGTVPTWLGTRGAVFETLRRGGRGSTDRSRPRLRQGLVVVEMALALVLLVAGGLFVRGLQRLAVDHPGWQVDGLLTARLPLPRARYGDDPERRRQLANRLEQRLAQLPGVTSSAVAIWLPLANFRTQARREALYVEGTPPPAPGSEPLTYVNGVSPGFFATLGITLREGRLLTPADVAGKAPVVVVNETMARHFWPGQSAIGKRIDAAQRSDLRAGERWRTVVGVVADVRLAGSLEESVGRFHVYYPLAHAVPGTLTVALRAPGPAPEALIGDLRRVVAELDPELPVYEPLSARALLDRALVNYAMTGWVLFGFALLGLLLAALGVYGLFAGFVAERTREIGVRVALGAQTAQVVWLVLGRGLRLALVGALVGLGGALAVVPVLRSVASELPAHDPMLVVLLALALVAVALLACWLPARRAARLDPLVALRSE
jgi:putative ABC transport system permease protein